MADPGRLDELQRKFEENPRRYFAPLASELRKAGDPERAVALCRAYLAEQPGHMSGYVVYGQALFDAGHRHQATEAFEQALALDPENMIAMRYLGDLAREGGELELATLWYRRLLDLDPKDEVLSAYLAEIASQGAQPGGAPALGEPEATGEEYPQESAPAESGPLEGDRGETHPVAFGVEEELPSHATPLAGGVPPFEEFHEPSEPFSGERAQEPAAGTQGGGEELFASHEPLLSEPIPPEAALAWAEMADPLMEMPALSAHGGEEGAPTQESPAEERFAEEPDAEEPDAEEPADVGAGPRGGASTLFVTETMATLYLRQGFPARALEVYRQLALLRPELRLEDKIRELEQTLAADAISVRDFFTRIGAKRPTTIAGPPVAPAAGGVGALLAGAPTDERDARAAAALAGAYGTSR